MSRAHIILLVPIVLSGFIHIWNPIGFPTAHNDEDAHYIPRALMFMQYGDPQKQNPGFYDHPFFGQILLGTLFKLIGYPDMYVDNSDVKSIHSLYMVPRIIMGLFAVLDTFIVYTIASVCYGRKVAFISSILFAVMPITWLLRWVLLDNVLLPFLLS
ncbi:MAG TPA: hypothetical protein VJS91_02080, partial [Nitrososphaeraceae archaeon]|nr:hypothetical protein [Nitrososphaeraceae archaeon]